MVAQEMFKESPNLTKTQKTLILGFMAGARGMDFTIANTATAIASTAYSCIMIMSIEPCSTLIWQISRVLCFAYLILVVNDCRCDSKFSVHMG